MCFFKVSKKSFSFENFDRLSFQSNSCVSQILLVKKRGRWFFSFIALQKIVSLRPWASIRSSILLNPYFSYNHLKSETIYRFLKSKVFAYSSTESISLSLNLCPRYPSSTNINPTKGAYSQSEIQSSLVKVQNQTILSSSIATNTLSQSEKWFSIIFCAKSGPACHGQSLAYQITFFQSGSWIDNQIMVIVFYFSIKRHFLFISTSTSSSFQS